MHDDIDGGLDAETVEAFRAFLSQGVWFSLNEGRFGFRIVIRAADGEPPQQYMALAIPEFAEAVRLLVAGGDVADA